MTFPTRLRQHISKHCEVGNPFPRRTDTVYTSKTHAEIVVSEAFQDLDEGEYAQGFRELFLLSLSDVALSQFQDRLEPSRFNIKSRWRQHWSDRTLQHAGDQVCAATDSQILDSAKSVLVESGDALFSQDHKRVIVPDSVLTNQELMNLVAYGKGSEPEIIPQILEPKPSELQSDDH